MSSVIIKKRKHSLDFFENGRWIYDLGLGQIKLHGIDLKFEGKKNDETKQTAFFTL